MKQDGESCINVNNNNPAILPKVWEKSQVFHQDDSHLDLRGYLIPESKYHDTEGMFPEFWLMAPGMPPDLLDQIGWAVSW